MVIDVRCHTHGQLASVQGNRLEEERVAKAAAGVAEVHKSSNPHCEIVIRIASDWDTNRGGR